MPHTNYRPLPCHSHRPAHSLQPFGTRQAGIPQMTHLLPAIPRSLCVNTLHSPTTDAADSKIRSAHFWAGLKHALCVLPSGFGMLVHTAPYGKLLVTAIRGRSHAGTHKSNGHRKMQGTRGVIMPVLGSAPKTITCQHSKVSRPVFGHPYSAV